MEEKGFFASLFDLSFTEFVTPRIIKVLFLLAIILLAVGALGVIVNGFANSLLLGLAALVFSPILFLLYVLCVRVWLEVIIIMFRIADNTRQTAVNTGAAPPSPGVGGSEGMEPKA